MHKRTIPKVFAYAKELRRELTPIEKKLWARLRAHRMKDVHFRAQHAIGNYVVDFPWHRPPGRCVPRARNSSLNWMEASTWNKQNTMPKELASLNQKITK